MAIDLNDITAHTVWTPAPDKSPQQYQDAFFPEESATSHGSRGVTRYCMVDGAARSGYSRQWAQCLVSEWGRDPDRLDFESSLVLASDAWKRWHEQHHAKPPPHVGLHDWFQATYPEDQLAYATLLVVQIFPGRYPSWFALAVGDTFVFHVRANELWTCLPKPAKASTTPNLISTQRNMHRDAYRMIERDGAELMSGDELFLSTDALGYWIADRVSQSPWGTLRTTMAKGPRAFQAWITELRERNEVKRDDTTLMRIAIS